MRTLRTSVRRLVEFLLREGNIDPERDWRGSFEAMQAGSRIHRMLQASAGDSYQAEVPLAGTFYFPDGVFNPYAARLDIREEAVRDQEGFFLRVEGRADGIIDDGSHRLTIDEIKGVTRDVSAIEKPAATHEAQALCYAYLYLRGKREPSALSSAFAEYVVVRLTYASMTTGEVRQIERTHCVPDIETWFFSLLGAAQRWAAWRIKHDELRERSLSLLAFPLTPRTGQQQIMDAVASAIREGTRLYVQAPTGSGKTIATMYPALKAMGAGEVARIAFLTAKTMTRGPVLECLDLLRKQDFAANVLIVTARNKICPLRSNVGTADMRSRPLASLCNPVECPLARGHYDSVNDALYAAITSCDVLDANRIAKVAARHHVCPYELQRDTARWADIIICDYHFAFSPSASLMGLADEPHGGDTVFLVDEAHNLVERMRDMYSAELTVADLKGLERLIRTGGDLGELTKIVRAALAAFPTWDDSAWDESLLSGAGARGRGGRPSYRVVRPDDELVDSLAALSNGISAALEQFVPAVGETFGYNSPGATPAGTPGGTPGRAPTGTPGRVPGGTPGRTPAGTPGRVPAGTPAGTPGRAPAGTPGRAPTGTPGRASTGTPGREPAGSSIEVFLALRDMDLKVRAFLGSLQRAEAGYVTFLARAEKGGRRLKVYCVDPSHDLGERLEQARAAIFFSGTLLPMDYHRRLLAAQEDDASIDAQSGFDHRHQQVLIGSDVSARYSRRGPKLYARIAKYLVALMHARPGNYLVFLPAYVMMEEAVKALGALADGTIEVVRQRPGMREDERERFVSRFRESRAAGASLVGLCVLGGIFGESIDLPGEALVGVVVVGTGMPRITSEREVIKEYFDAREGKGFSHAYTYPGMSKVLQAAGRLIRTEEDRGVVLLLDDRFLTDELREAFPKEWKNVRSCTLETLPGLLAHS